MAENENWDDDFQDSTSAITCSPDQDASDTPPDQHRTLLTSRSSSIASLASERGMDDDQTPKPFRIITQQQRYTVTALLTTPPGPSHTSWDDICDEPCLELEDECLELENERQIEKLISFERDSNPVDVENGTFQSMLSITDKKERGARLQKKDVGKRRRAGKGKENVNNGTGVGQFVVLGRRSVDYSGPIRSAHASSSSSRISSDLISPYSTISSSSSLQFASKPISRSSSVTSQQPFVESGNRSTSSAMGREEENESKRHDEKDVGNGKDEYSAVRVVPPQVDSSYPLTTQNSTSTKRRSFIGRTISTDEGSTPALSTSKLHPPYGILSQSTSIPQTCVAATYTASASNQSTSTALASSTSRSSFSRYHDKVESGISRPSSALIALMTRIRSASRPPLPPATPPTRRIHRPSLSSIVVPSSPSIAPHGLTRGGRTSLSIRRCHTMSMGESGDIAGTSYDSESNRASDAAGLKIPRRITASQSRIEADLAWVKQFAKGIDDIKALRIQYDRLSLLLISSQSTESRAVSQTSQRISRLGIEYESWWEQADAFVNLGEGKKPTPSLIASRRARCSSLASDNLAGSISMEGEGKLNIRDVRPSLAERQEYMLKEVLVNPVVKGESVPSGRIGRRLIARGRTQEDVVNVQSANSPRSSTKPIPTIGLFRQPYPASTRTTSISRSSQLRQVSLAGLAGIKDFLIRLRVRVAEDLSRSAPIGNDHRFPEFSISADGRRNISDPVATMERKSSPVTKPLDPNLTIGSLHATAAILNSSSLSLPASSEAEDWNEESWAVDTISDSVDMRRTNTEPSSSILEGCNARIVLTTESMPSLLLKMKEVQDQCTECLIRLKGLTS